MNGVGEVKDAEKGISLPPPGTPSAGRIINPRRERNILIHGILIFAGLNKFTRTRERWGARGTLYNSVHTIPRWPEITATKKL